MKIGLVLSNTPAYSETFFTSKIKGLQKNGFEVILFVAHQNTAFHLCTVCKAPYSSKKNPFKLFFSILKVVLKLVFKLKRLIKFIKFEKEDGANFIEILKKIYLNTQILTAKNIDWLHFGFATQAIGKENLAKTIGAKMAVSIRGFDINVYPLKNPNCYKLLWKKVNKVHSISKYLYKKANLLGLTYKAKHEIITPAISVNNTTSEYKSKNTKLKIITIGRLNWIKGISIAITAMGKLKNTNIPFEFHIIGGGTQEEFEYNKFIAHKLELINEIKFHGELSHEESLSLLSTADLYIQTSINEGFCNAVLEAQAMGILPIVSDAGGLPENVLNNITGWVIKKNSPKLLAEKIVEVINLPESNKEKIRKQAIERVKKEFNIEKQQKEFIDFYTQ